MSALDAIAEGCCRPDWNKLDTADYIISLLHRSGYVILSSDEVRGIRDLAVWALDEVGCDVQLTPGLDITLKALEARDG